MRPKYKYREKIDKVRLLELYNSGLNSIQIAKEFNCGHRTVRDSLLRNYGLRSNGRRGGSGGSCRTFGDIIGQEKINKVIDLYKSGVSYNVINLVTGVSNAHIYRILCRYNIPLRAKKIA